MRPAAVAERVNLPFDPAWLALPAGVATAAVVLLWGPVTGDAAVIVAITLFCVSLWIGTPVEPWFTALVGLGLIGLAFSTDLALVGFHSPATWLIVLGLLMGAAVRSSGLADAAERVVLRHAPERAAGDALATYRYLLVVLSAVGLGLAVLVPSSLVRVLVFGPVLLSVGEVFTERRPRVGVFLGPLFATYYGASGILTGSLANIIIAGLVEANAGISIGWVEWVVWLGPVMAVGRVAVIVVIAYVLYRPRDPDDVVGPGAYDATGTTGKHERRMLAFLLVGVAVWATDSVHGLHPFFGALVVVVLAFGPRIGVAGRETLTEADFSIVFFIGAIFAIAEGLQQTGFTDAAAGTLLSWLPADAPFVVVLAFVVVVAMVLALLMEGLAVASVLTPILVSFSASTGVPLVPVAMIEAVALNTYFFPYQSAVLVAILGLEMVDSVELMRMATACSLATLFLLLPLQIAIFAVF